MNDTVSTSAASSTGGDSENNVIDGDDVSKVQPSDSTGHGDDILSASLSGLSGDNLAVRGEDDGCGEFMRPRYDVRRERRNFSRDQRTRNLPNRNKIIGQAQNTGLSAAPAPS